MTSTESPSARWLRPALLLPIGAALVLHSLVYDFVCDDAFISFVYARNLAEHGQLVFNLGVDPTVAAGVDRAFAEPVEGFTNLLYTLLLAGLMKLGAAPELTSRLLGTLFGLGTLVVTLRLMERVRGRASLWDLAPAALLAASSGFAAWCSGGLETQMFTLLVVLALHELLADRHGAAGLALGAAALTRPEGLLVAGLVVLHRFATNLLVERRLRPTRTEWRFAIALLGVVLPALAWRWSYYGWPLPNTAYVKAGVPAGLGPAALRQHAVVERELLAQGLFYVWQWAWQSKALLALPLVVVAAVRHRRFASLALLLLTVWLAYAVKVGGDFMGLHRFVMPLFVLVALLASLGAAALVERLPARARPLAVAAALALLALFGFSQARLTRRSLVPVADHGIDRPGYLAQYADDRALVGRALAPHLRPDDFSFVGGVGVQPYYARMRAYDVFGLVSEEIAHTVMPTRPRPGHQKWAPAELVLRYRPTFIFHCYALHRDPARYQLGCGELSAFRAAGYAPVTLFVPGARADAQYYSFLKHRDRAWP
ncbi:MAG: hypothetical protein EXR73_04040 [Myxococcales bacterium]|nr:hypothetical protein [Myxococcales bacterium]